jgi:CelD/BcsL family acetyltransferase involved in cellulose biosynthesis
MMRDELLTIEMDEERSLVSRNAAQARLLRRSEIDDTFVREWRSLAGRSVSPNPFLDPAFVLPAIDELPDLPDPVFIAVESSNGTLTGLGIFEEVSSSRRMPIAHLRAWQTPHTYLDGLLLDRDSADQAMAAIWSLLLEPGNRWHGVEFPRLKQGDALDSILEQSADQAHIDWQDGRLWTRAALNLDVAAEGESSLSASTKRAKSLRRGWHELQRHGAVEFRIVHESDEIPDATSNFLFLEALGWKAASGTAVDCCPQQRRFFERMVQLFAADDRAFFSQITIDSRPIATVAHLVSGAGAFAYKLGWDPQFERGCPGYQLKAKLAEHASLIPAGVEWVDSCASEGSFIEHVWSGRTTLRNRMFVTSRAGSVIASVLGGLRGIRDAFRGK